MNHTSFRPAALIAVPLIALATAPVTPAWAQQTDVANVTVENPDGLLSDSDVNRLIDRTNALELPEVVSGVTYLLFQDYAQGADHDMILNDTVEAYARDNRPDLIEGEYYSDGNLILAVGYDPNYNGIYCGNDVCDELDLWEGDHLDYALDVAKDDLRDDNVVSGLIASAEAAIDPNAAPPERTGPNWGAIIGGILGGIGAIIAAVTVFFVSRSQRKKTADKARDNYAFTMAHYGEVARKLDAIDVRAHSLTSPLANAKLRNEWAEVRDRFLELHDKTQSFDELTADSTDQDFRAKRKELEEAATVTRQVVTAEENIDLIFDMEHGDLAARLKATEDLQTDLIEAQETASSDELKARAGELIARTDQLRADPSAEDFLEKFVVLLGDVSTLIGHIDEQEFSDVDRDTERIPPKLYDRDYRVGTGVYNYVPFMVVHSWHQQDVSTAQAASSSSANTSYSSGFSGGGGSSSF